MAVTSAAERIEEGRKRRNFAHRESHAHLHPKNRGFDPIGVLMAADAGRLKELLPLKYGRMRASRFAFFRGSAAVMAADLARLPNSGIPVQLCGDAHVQNLGSFAGPNGRLVFDLNDFDETIRGPWEWDVKRMAASIVLAGLESDHDRAACEVAAAAFAEKYCESIREFSELPVLRMARLQVRRENKVVAVHAALLQSQKARPADLMSRYVETDAQGNPRFRNLGVLFRPVTGQEKKRVLESLGEYRDSLPPERRHFFDLFRSVDVAFKVVGTGSVGLRNYVVFFEGNGSEDPMFLQIKEEVRSAYAKYLAGDAAVENQGQRAAEGQRAIQPMSDPLLGWTRIDKGIGKADYLVRQLNDHKGSIDIANLRGAGLRQLGLIAGELLARGHARSGDACQIRGYCGSPAKTGKIMAAFAMEYADQTEIDYRLFLAAIRKGRIKAAAVSKAG